MFGTPFDEATIGRMEDERSMVKASRDGTVVCFVWFPGTECGDSLIDDGVMVRGNGEGEQEGI